MKRKLVLTLMFAGIVVCSHTPAQAQFFKKIFGKDQPERKPRPRPKPPTNADTKKAGTGDKKRTQPEEIVFPKTIKKNRYRIDVFVALHLNEFIKNKPVNKDQIPERATPGMNFYEGIRLAADSLDKSGYQMDVYVHDISDPKETPEALIAAKAIDSTDLIIGSVPANLITPLAAFAKKRMVNFVSTMSPSDGNVKSNPYFTLLQPTLNAHCDWIRNLVIKKWRAMPVVVYRRPAVNVDETAFKALVKDSVYKFTTVNVTSLPQANYLRAMFDSTEINVVLMPVIDAGYATKLLNQLDSLFPDYRFEVYGMPSWKGMAALKKTNAMSNIGISITAPFYFDGSTASGQALANDYKKTFGGRPGEMVYRGYETMYWYSYLLAKYGTIFNPKIADNASANYTRFDIKPRFDKDFNMLYYENTHFYLFRYQDGSFAVEQ